MSRFRLISTIDSGPVLHINNAFIRMLALESARLGPDVRLPSVVDEEGTSARERYAPMHRLLTQDDELFLAGEGFPLEAHRLRREHRRCYFAYVTRLRREIRMARKLGALAMASRENWNFWTLLAHTVISESSLLYLQWLGCRHAAGVNVSMHDVKECLDFLLAGPRFHLATT